MRNEELKEVISKITPEAAFEEKKFLTATVPAEKLHVLAEYLKNLHDTGFDYLFCQTAVDWLQHFTIVYHLRSTMYGHELVVKTNVPRENPSVDTVSDIWKTAEFHEREIFDLFGIHFKNHQDLRRILLEEHWQGFPLRKDYKDDVNIVEL